MRFGVASTERQRGCTARLARICQQKSGLMKYSTHGWRAPSWMWLTRCVSGNSLRRPPPLPLPLHEASRPVRSKPRPPSRQIREAEGPLMWGTLGVMTWNISVWAELVMDLLMWKYLHCRRGLSAEPAEGASDGVIAGAEGFCRLHSGHRIQLS